jgi:hypothetical protein
LTLWEGSVTRCDGVATSTGGEPASGRGKGGDDVSWVDVNPTRPKNDKNQPCQFNFYKWMIKI